ncbi:diguanylate cyclase [Maribrevibacterium harenarium]|uniref:Diguanylate cyclase n=1 Tax=Maribrevibacterium harenarium TaxID=2589817 RepID=A0A501X595_9GAMM|nr:diguanylate cyclase [Maribrevibacterium harenarium]TPE55654.1 diguanylate cyclase [Maribrevibacterium harenarium]
MDRLKIQSSDLMHLIEAFPAACCIFDKETGKARYYNEAFASLWQLPRYLESERILTTHTIEQRIIEDFLPVHVDRALVQTTVNKSQPIRDYSHKKAEISYRRATFEMTFTNGMVGEIEVWRDVTHEYNLYNKLQDEHALLVSLINTIPEQVYIKDNQSRFLRINPALAQRYGIADPNEAIGRSDADFYTQEHASVTAKEEQEIMATGKGIFNQLHHETWQDGHETWNLSTKLPLKNRLGEIIGIIGISHDITEHKENEARIWQQANFDALTGLSNRTHLKAEFQRIQLKSRQQHLPMAVILLDLDGFKEVNDTYGHECGDLLLTGVAKRLQTTLRSSDAIARLGGDEFAIIIGNIKDQADLTRVADKLLECLTVPFEIDQHIINISASLGVVLGNPQFATLETLMRQADQAMYQAKECGKSCYKLFTNELAIENSRRNYLSGEINKSIQAHEFSLEFQPLLCAKTGDFAIFEGLTRWRHSKFARIEPKEFLPIAESTGAIIKIESLNIIKAVELINHLKKREFEIEISLNISPLFLAQPEEMEACLLQLDVEGNSLSQLYFEVDMDILFQPSERIMQTLAVARSYGIGLILDNVGESYFSIELISELDVKLIKLASNLTIEAETNPIRAKTVAAVCAMAKAMEVDVVAKHIETPAEMTKMTELGCDYLQGHFIQNPISHEFILELGQTEVS